MKKISESSEGGKKTIKTFILKADPGRYGKNGKQFQVDDIIEIHPDTDKYNLPISNPMRIYEKKKGIIFTQDRLLLGLLVILSLILISLKFFFNDNFTSEKEKNFEQLVSGLCFAYISSYIFYLIVIKKSEISRKKEAFAVICGLVDSLVDNGKEVYDIVAKGTDIEEELLSQKRKMDRATFKRACSRVNIEKQHEGFNQTIGQVLILYGVKKIDFYTSKIYEFMPFLDGTMVKHLNRIQNSKFHRTITLLPTKVKKDIKEYSEDIFTFLELVEELEIYNATLKEEYLSDYESKY